MDEIKTLVQDLLAKIEALTPAEDAAPVDETVTAEDAPAQETEVAPEVPAETPEQSEVTA